MKLAVLAAVARNLVIGANGTIPWHIREDLQRFKRLTMGHTVLMGRKTYTSLGKPLAGRRNVVVSSGQIPDVESYPDIDAALDAVSTDGLVFVIGGATIYTQLLGRADYLYLTLVDQSPEGDTFFPPYEHLLGTVFMLEHRDDREGYHFLDYRRVNEHSP